MLMDVMWCALGSGGNQRSPERDEARQEFREHDHQ